MNIIKISFIFLLFCFSITAKASDLERLSRAYWPDSIDNAADAVQYLVSPFGYKLVINNEAGKSLHRIQPLLVRNPFFIAKTNALLLRIVPSDIIIKIDDQNKLIQFWFFDEVNNRNINVEEK